MRVVFAALFLISSSLAAISFSGMVNSENMWWCKSCHLAYPASTKVCLNKDCPMFRKKR